MQPNIFIFFTDQQRWDTTGAAGCPLDLTPHFDRVAREGTYLKTMVTCQPVCGPARASLQTGLYASQAGCHINGIPLDPGIPTAARHLRAAGYATGYVGKWHLGPQELNGPVPAAYRNDYDFWLGANCTEMVSDAYDTVLYDKEDREVRLPGYRVDATVDAAIRWISQPRDEPFFCTLSLLEPHHQNHRDDYPAPHGADPHISKGWLPPDLRALGGDAHRCWDGYLGMIQRIDQAFGRIMDVVETLPDSRDTIVLFVSDHGCHFKTRNSEYKRSCHEASVRLPAMIWGGPFMGGGERPELVSLVDVVPTLLDAAGCSGAYSGPGRSLLPHVQRNPDAPVWENARLIQISESQCGRAIRTGRWKYAVTAPECDPGAPHAATYEESELYDLWSDPYELRNLIGADSHTQVADWLRRRLLDLLAEAGEPRTEIRSRFPHSIMQSRLTGPRFV